VPKRVAISIVSLLAAAPVLAQSTAPRQLPTLDPGGVATPQSAELAIPSVSSLFRDLGGDFKRLPSWETAIVLGVTGGASWAISSNDAELSRRAVASDTMDDLFEPGEGVGNGAIQVGGALATYVLGRTMHSPGVARLGADLVRAQIVSAALTQGVKLSVGRRRPDQGRNSFPSGHASATFATAAVLHRHYGFMAAAPAYALATFVAGSRVQERHHFLSDVVFGAGIGIVSGRTVGLGHGRGRLAFAPFAAPGGGGVNLTLVDRP
jgi:membrane-associated phospholipid phosphatase